MSASDYARVISYIKAEGNDIAQCAKALFIQDMDDNWNYKRVWVFKQLLTSNFYTRELPTMELAFNLEQTLPEKENLKIKVRI